MGGGVVSGEPYIRYPYSSSGTPGYSSVFPPRRRSSFWGNESFPEELTNLARKRKLDGVKGESLGVSNGKNVREIVVEDSSMSRSSPTHKSQGYGNAGTSSGNSPASLRGGSRSLAPSEGHTVTIPVVFTSGEVKHQPVPVVSPEGTKKPRRTFSEEAAAVLIQSVFRGYLIRRTKPLEHMRNISSIRTKLKDFERQLSDTDVVEKMRTDMTVRLRITEGIMALLLQLDAIQGVHPDIRVWRKAVTKEVVTLQERVDILLNGDGETLEPPLEGHDDEDTAMAVEEGNAAEDIRYENDDAMTEIVHSESLPESKHTEGNWPEEIVLDQLKLGDDEVDDEVVQDVCADVGERAGEVTMDNSDLESGDFAVTMEQTGGRQELRIEAMQDGGLMLERSDHRQQHTRSKSQDAHSSGAAGFQTMDTKGEPMTDDGEATTEGAVRKDEELRGEEAVIFSTDVAEHGEGGWTDAPAETETFEGPEATAGQGMELDRDESPPGNRGEELTGSPYLFDCKWNRSPRERETLKNLLKEISSPSERTAPVPHCVRLSGAEETDCHGAPGACSDHEENDGAAADSGPGSKSGNDEPDARAEASGWTEKPEPDGRLLKLCEENKLLKSLLLDVMKWNQLQANNMRNVTERLEKLEERLMAKQKKSSSKPKGQRCTRSRLERRLRR